MVVQRIKYLLLIPAVAAWSCTAFDGSGTKKAVPEGLVATPPSYYSTAKGRYLGEKYKENLDRLIEKIVSHPKTAALQFANNISSVGGIGFFTHSAVKTADERYLEVVMATPESFEDKGEVNFKVQRLFSQYGSELLALLNADSEIFQDKALHGYGLNLAWRNVIKDQAGNRVTMARTILYFPKEKVRSFVRRELSHDELLKSAVIFSMEQNGPLALVSYQPAENRAEFRPPIREDTLVPSAAPTRTASAPDPKPKEQAAKSEGATKDAPAVKRREAPEPAKEAAPLSDGAQAAVAETAAVPAAENLSAMASKEHVLSAEAPGETPSAVTQTAETTISPPASALDRTARAGAGSAMRKEEGGASKAIPASEKSVAGIERGVEALAGERKGTSSPVPEGPGASDFAPNEDRAQKMVADQTGNDLVKRAEVNVRAPEPKQSSSESASQPDIGMTSQPASKKASAQGSVSVSSAVAAGQTSSVEPPEKPVTYSGIKKSAPEPIQALHPMEVVKPKPPVALEPGEDATARPPGVKTSAPEPIALPAPEGSAPPLFSVPARADLAPQVVTRVEPQGAAPGAAPDASSTKTAKETPAGERLAALRKPPEAISERKTVVRPAPKALEGFIIQLGFGDKEKARHWAEAMERRGYAVSITEAGSGALRLRIGNFSVREEAERQLRTLKQEGLSGIVINLPQSFQPTARASMP